MNKHKKKGNKFLQTISGKITSMQTTYDIDEDYPNLNNINTETSKKSNIENPENTEYNDNNILKESIITPIENEPQSPQSLSSINSVFCKFHNKAFLKLDQNNFEIVCQKCLEEGNKSQLEIETDTTSRNADDIYDSEFNCYIHNDIKGSFYCDQCKEFICKMCFDEDI